MSDFVEYPIAYYDAHGGAAFAGFNPAATGFTLANARAMMWMAQLAYETKQRPTIDHAMSLWGFTRIDTFARTSPNLFEGIPCDSRGIIAERGDAIVVAFAGTDPAVWQNIITDASVVGTGASETHAGFAAAASVVWNDIQSAITSTSKPVFVTGHSLGGALAALSGLRAAESQVLPAAGYLFGTPRVGNANFAERYNTLLGERTFRLVHGSDAVACVPPPKLGFRHVGRMLSCKSGGNFPADATLQPMTGDAPGPRGQVMEALTAGLSMALKGKIFQPPGPGPLGPIFRLLPNFIRDHVQASYLKALT